jgi:hypothetical protein
MEPSPGIEKTLQMSSAILRIHEFLALRTKDTMGYFGCCTFALSLSTFGVPWTYSSRGCAQPAGQSCSPRNHKILAQKKSSGVSPEQYSYSRSRTGIAKLDGHEQGMLYQ